MRCLRWAYFFGRSPGARNFASRAAFLTGCGLQGDRLAAHGAPTFAPSFLFRTKVFFSSAD